jgi:hypothetical protein
MNVPSGLETSRGPLRPEGEAELSRESISSPVGKPVPGRKTVLGWQL